MKRLPPLHGGRRDSAGSGQIDPDLLRLLGVGLDDAAAVETVLAEVVEEAQAVGMAPDLMAPVVQAYARGISRVVDAEAEFLAHELTDLPPKVGAERLRALVERLLPIGDKAFPVLHRALLRSVLGETVPRADPGECRRESLAIALVDLSASTPYLVAATREEVQRMVDVLFEAGQTACHDRPVRAAKYVGDGVFLVGRDVQPVASAAFEALGLIERMLPLRARAGLAYGPVLRRAGDYFGLPVNVAQALTKSAQPGSVLATADAAETLAAEFKGARFEITARGVDDSIGVVELIRSG